MVAVRGEDQNGAVVPDLLADEAGGPIGKRDVVPSEAFFSSFHRRDDDDSAGAETEREDGTVCLGEVVECSMEGEFYEVEVAEDGDGRRTWREVSGLL